MEPKDKFGNPLFPRLFQKLQDMGQRLERCGYREAKQKPNLFVKRWPGVAFFVDFRGTHEIPIWEDYAGLFYWKFTDPGLPLSVRQQMVKLESGRTADVPKRLATLMESEAAEEGAEFEAPPDSDRRVYRGRRRSSSDGPPTRAQRPVPDPQYPWQRQYEQLKTLAESSLWLARRKLFAVEQTVCGIPDCARREADSTLNVAREKVDLAIADALAAQEAALQLETHCASAPSDQELSLAEARRLLAASRDLRQDLERVRLTLQVPPY